MFGKDYITHQELEAVVQQLIGQMADQQDTISKLACRVSQLEKEVKDLSATTSTDDTPKRIIAEKDDTATATPQSPRTMQTFYLPAPSADGVFAVASDSEQTGSSIYQMTTDDGQNGRFIMLSTPDAIATAMISVSQFVKPVCRVEGNTHVLPRHIETLEEGTVKKVDGGWRVQQKAIVRFA